jgi:hypothetical protein
MALASQAENVVEVDQNKRGRRQGRVRLINVGSVSLIPLPVPGEKSGLTHEKEPMRL